jgi:hypothetical protein
MKYTSAMANLVQSILNGITDPDPSQHGMTTDEERTASLMPQVITFSSRSGKLTVFCLISLIAVTSTILILLGLHSRFCVCLCLLSTSGHVTTILPFKSSSHALLQLQTILCLCLVVAGRG